MTTRRNSIQFNTQGALLPQHYSPLFSLINFERPRLASLSSISTMNGGGDSRVSIPNSARKAIQQVNKTLGSKHSDEFVYTTLQDCGMDPNEACRRLKMIHDIGEIAGKHSVEDVYTMLKDCNMDPNEAAQRLLYIDTFHEVKKKQDRRKPISIDTSEDYRQNRGYQWRGANGGRGTFHSSRAFDDVNGGRNLNPRKENGVTNRFERVSKPILPAHSGKEEKILHVAKSDANANGTAARSNGSYSYKVAPELFTAVPSTPVPVVFSSQNTKHMCAVGTIKCEIVRRNSCNKSNGRIPDSCNTKESESNIVEKTQISDSVQNSSHVIDSNVVEKSQISEDMLVSTISVSEEESEVKLSSPKVEEKSCNSTVIFPDHVQVPDNLKNQFIFGTLDASVDDDSKPLSMIESPGEVVTESSQRNCEFVTESSSSNENVSPTAEEDESQDHQQLPNGSENVLLPLEDKISSDPDLKHEQPKVEVNPPIAGFQNHVLQPTREYGFGYMPHLIGPQFVQIDAPELQSGSSTTQAAIAGQGSMAMSPPVFPYFRHPNYIPYNPYYHPMFLPHLFNHGVFPLPPGLKFHAPPSHEDLNPKDNNNLHSTVQQGPDETQVWAQAAARDAQNILPNYSYNFPQAYPPMAFSHGLYQTMPLAYQTQPTSEPMVQPQIN